MTTRECSFKRNMLVDVAVRMVRDLYQGKNGLLLLLRIDSVTEMILMLYASLCASICVWMCVSFCVYLPWSAFQIKCTCCLIHHLNRQLLQSTRTLWHMHVCIHSDINIENER